MIKGKSFLFAITTTLSLTSLTLAQINPDYPIKPVPAKNIQITDKFWAPKIETNHKVTIPHVLEMCEETGRIDNFSIAAGNKKGEHRGFIFNDSDVYKTIQAVAYSLENHPDKELEKYADEIIDKIADAQWDDGYLFTPYSIPQHQPEKRWSNIRDNHELYCAGHLFEAATAYYKTTNKRKLLEVALKFADYIDSVFGPNKKNDAPGHEEIEIGLIKLYQLTNEEKYLKLANFFIDQRGNHENRQSYETQAQDHIRVTQQKTPVGHAVRAAYLYCAVTDIAALTENPKYLNALDSIWNSLVSKKLYITGGIGSRHGGESFGDDYELPNLSAYCETCAAIGNIFWNHRLFLLKGHAKYIDILERTLYNGCISGVSLEGDKFFYTNPLKSQGQHSRSRWFGCACCPTNIVRLLPSIPAYIYAYENKNIYINLYIADKAEIKIPNNTLKVEQKTRYPWDGNIKINITIQKPEDFTIFLRIPCWAENQPLPGNLYHFYKRNNQPVALKVNGEVIEPLTENGYVPLKRKWEKSDTIELNLPMPVRRISAHPNVRDDTGKVALQKGPIVYCAESRDNNGQVTNLLIPDNTKLKSEFRPDLLNGIQVIEGKAVALAHSEEDDSIIETSVPFLAIPYYAWANRGESEMAVWLPANFSAATPLPAPTIASKSNVTTSGGTDPQAVNNQLVPENSNDHSVPYFHWWPKKGSKEWVTFSFDKPQRISTIQVYWFDDTGQGECRTPESWKIFYEKNGEFKSVINPKGLGTEKDKFNNATFEPVRTNAIRIEVNLRKNFSAGIYETLIE